jgi:hypothetical protein
MTHEDAEGYALQMEFVELRVESFPTAPPVQTVHT